VLKHIGTAHTEEELEKLKQSAQTWIIHNPPPVFVTTQTPNQETALAQDFIYTTF
jgi:hypothetical protein